MYGYPDDHEMTVVYGTVRCSCGWTTPNTYGAIHDFTAHLDQVAARNPSTP
jgi:hypothetical protein